MANFPTTPVNTDTFTDDSGRIWTYEDGMWLANAGSSASANTNYVQEGLPAAPIVGDTLYTPSTDRFYYRVNDGNSDLWLKLS